MYMIKTTGILILFSTVIVSIIPVVFAIIYRVSCCCLCLLVFLYFCFCLFFVAAVRLALIVFFNFLYIFPLKALFIELCVCA